MAQVPIYKEPSTIENVASLFSCSGRQKLKGAASKGSEQGLTRPICIELLEELDLIKVPVNRTLFTGMPRRPLTALRSQKYASLVSFSHEI